MAYILVTPKAKSEDWRRLVYNVMIGSSQRLGYTVVDSAGAVQDEGGGDLATGLLGNIGFEPLPGPGEQKWQERRMMTFARKIEATPRGQTSPNNLPQFGQGGHGSPRSFGHHQRGNPARSPPAATPATAGPATRTEHHGRDHGSGLGNLGYEIVNNTTGLVTIKKKSGMATLPAAEGQPSWFVAKGEGIIEIDTNDGAIRSSNFTVSLSSPSAPKESSTLKLSYQRMENGKLASLPATPSTSRTSANPPGGFHPSTTPGGGSTSAVPAPAGLAPAGTFRGPRPSWSRFPARRPGAGRKIAGRPVRERVRGARFQRQADRAGPYAFWPRPASMPGTADHYVVLDRARDLAMTGGDLRLTCQTIDTLAAFYQVSNLKLKAGALGALAELIGPADQQRVLVATSLSLLDQAIAADELEVARTLGKVAFAAARKTEDKELISKTSERGKAFKRCKRILTNSKRPWSR